MRKLFERSEETKKLVRFLAALDKGEQVSYRKLSDIAERAIDARAPTLISARRILEREHNQVWICVQPKIGLRRLHDPEIAERLPRWWLSGARQKLHRGGEQSEVVELHALDIDQQARFSIDCIQRSLAFDALSKQTRRRMERVARGNSNDLPAFTAVEWAINLTKNDKGKG